MQQTYLLCCPCHFGLERTLRFEISKIGGTDIAAQDGRVLFRGRYGDHRQGKSLPLYSRTCSHSAGTVQGVQL